MKYFFILVLLFFTNQFATAVGSSPEELVRETTLSVLEQLRINRNELEQHPEKVKQIVREIIVAHFDFVKMTELVLGSYWQQISKTDQACIADGFRNTLVERYAYILLSYDNHEIIYSPSKPIGERGFRLVEQTISREKMEPLPIGYIMEPIEGNWNVVELIIDGISLVRNYRGIYQSRIHLHGIEYFIKNLQECNN